MGWFMRLGLKFAVASRMPLRVIWILLFSLAVNISPETVHSYGLQYGSEPGNVPEAERTPATGVPSPRGVSCDGIKGQGTCSEMPSRGGRNDPSFQAAIYDATSFGGASQESANNAYSSQVFASSLNSNPSVTGSNLVQNMQHVGFNTNGKYDPISPHVVSYGSVYRLSKPPGVYSSIRTTPSASYIPPLTSSLTSSKFWPTPQNGYQAGYSRINYAAPQQGDDLNSATYYSRTTPSLRGMVISSGPIITFIMPNQSNDQLVQTTNKSQHGYEPDATIKPLVTDQPTAETSKPFKYMQAINDQRSTFSLQMLTKCPFLQSVKNSIVDPTPHSTSGSTSTPQSKTTEPRFTQVGNTYSSADTTSSFKAAQPTYMYQTPKPVKTTQHLAELSQDSSSPTVPLSGNVYGTSESTGTTVFNYMQHLYQAGPSFSKLGYSSPSSAVVSGFAQSGNVYGSADNAFTLNAQTSSSSLSLNPYFIARQGGRSYPTFKPLQSSYKSFLTRYTQMVSDQLNQKGNQMSDV